MIGLTPLQYLKYFRTVHFLDPTSPNPIDIRWVRTVSKTHPEEGVTVIVDGVQGKVQGGGEKQTA